MDDRHCFVGYYGFDQWGFTGYQDGDVIFQSKHFNDESECITASQLWLKGESK